LRAPGSQGAAPTLSLARRLRGYLSDAYIAYATPSLIPAARITRDAVDVEPSLRPGFRLRTVAARSDNMERPTSALHLSRITLDLRQLRAEPHTKEVGHHAVYSSDCVRSACRHEGGGGVAAGAADAGAADPGVG